MTNVGYIRIDPDDPDDVGDEGDKGNDEGDMTLTGEEWGMLRKYVEGLEARVAEGDRPSEWQLLKAVKDNLDTLGDLPNSEAALDDFYVKLLQQLIAACNASIRDAGSAAQADAERRTYVPADAPLVAAEMAAAVERLGKLSKEDLQRAIVQGPLFGEEPPSSENLVKAAEEGQLVNDTASLLKTIETRVRRRYAQNAVKLT